MKGLHHQLTQLKLNTLQTLCENNWFATEKYHSQFPEKCDCIKKVDGDDCTLKENLVTISKLSKLTSDPSTIKG